MLRGKWLMSSKNKKKKQNQKPEIEVGTIKFSFADAFRFSLESIRKRFTRALITSLSVLLGIAFMVTILTMTTILGNVGKQPPGPYQYWMVLIALLVCGVGIINSMLMSVTERYKEIGTMKCLGATNSSVLQIFLVEALLLGLLGGVIGAVVGWVAAIGIYGVQFGISAIFPAANLTAVLTTYLSYIGTAIGVAALLSIGAASYPALYAARLNPAEALRFEI
jgi:ABC-type antimicrobial peptide transport system permease subunit